MEYLYAVAAWTGGPAGNPPPPEGFRPAAKKALLGKDQSDTEAVGPGPGS